MKRLVLFLTATVFSAPALAADVVYNEPPAPMPMAIEAPALTWTGLYVGVQGGGAFNPSNGDNVFLDTSFGGPVLSGGADAFRNNFSSDFGSSFIGGGHIGYDYQMGGIVLGAIADINAVDISKTATAFSNTPAFYETERSLNYLGTVRARVGAVVMDRGLAYVTGGLAYGNVNYGFRTDSPVVSGNARSNAAATPAIVNEDEDNFGYTVGGGMEVLVTQNLSFGAEYLYTNLGSGNSTTTLNGGPFAGGVGGRTTFRTNDDFDFHTVTAKLSYRFN